MFAFKEKCTETISSKCYIAIKINSSSINNRCSYSKNRSGIGFSDLVKQTTLIISNEKLDNILKIVKSLEDSSLLVKGIRETNKNEEVK